jgi:hypothetical protein
LSKPMFHMKSSFLLLRFNLWIVFGIVAINIIVNSIVSLSMGGNDDPQVSVANMLTVFLIVIGIVLPTGYFKGIINLGATRKEYYSGLLMVYTIWSAIFAVFNILGLKLEIGFNWNTFNILQIFHWDQFGVAGMFVYQFGVYMLLISLLSLLFSGLRHIAGWVIWAALVAATPIFISIAPLRHKLVGWLQTLLFNDSLLQGFGWTFILSCVFLAVGWWFTARRTF